MTSTARSVLVFLACAAAAWAGCPGGGVPPDPQAQIYFERLDTSRYPDVDVYFRIIDTNPKTGFHEPQVGEVVVQDGADGTLASMEVKEHNFANPILRPIAMALCLDRSKSVDPVINHILDAIREYINLMVPKESNTPRFPDQTYLMALCGDADLVKVKELLFPADVNEFNKQDAFNKVNATFLPTCGGSPIYKASLATLDRVGAHPFEEPESARAAVLITDGKNNRPPATPDDLIAQARTSGIYVFTIGPVLIKANPPKAPTVSAKSVCRGALIDIARETSAAYFEATPPGAVLLPEPPTPDNPETPPSEPILPSERAVEYMQNTLLTVKNIAKQSPTLDRNADLEPEVAQAIQQFTTLNVSPSKWENYITALEAGPPAIINTPQITYALVAALDAGLEKFAADNTPTIDAEAVKKTYHDEIAGMMKKIQYSLKRVYRVTYTVPDAPFDGKNRTVRISTDYVTDVNGTARRITATKDAVYKAPMVVKENETRDFFVPVAGDRVTRLTANVPPRTPGAWSPDLQVDSTIALYGMAGSPPRPVKLAEKTAAVPEAWPTEQEGGPAQPLTEAEREELRPYLRAVNVNVALAPGGVQYTLAAGMPTCVPDATARPVANDANPDRPRLYWYSVSNTMKRAYTYTATLPGNVKRAQTGVAKALLNPLVFYVQDVTPPTLAVYLTPESRGTSRVAGVEMPIEQSPPQRAYFLAGQSFGVMGDAKKLNATGADLAEPLAFDGGSSIGFVVPQGVSVRLAILARDNFDRNVKPEWPPPADTAAVNAYDDATPSDEAARDLRPPFLARINGDQFDVLKDGGKTRWSGVTWSFLEGGGEADAGVETRSFRSANVNVDGDTITPLSGQDIVLQVRAVDASGNKTTMKLPVRVTPVGIEIDKLFQERERK